MHDSIQKFSQEQNESMIQTVTSDNNNANIPWSLTNIEEGSLNPEIIVKHLIYHITSIKGALSCLRQFLTTEISLKMMKNAFYFTLKVIFVLKIFKCLS